MTDRPARAALYSELMWPEYNPTSEGYGTGAEKANALLDAFAAEERAAAPAGPAPATNPTTIRAQAFTEAADEVARWYVDSAAGQRMRDGITHRLRRLAREAQQDACGRTESVTGEEYPPCARPADHREAYCRSADGQAYFLALYGPRPATNPAREAQQDPTQDGEAKLPPMDPVHILGIGADDTP